MTEAEAQRIVDDMLLVCQKLRSNIDDPELGLQAHLAEWFADGVLTVERVKTDLYPWLYGEKNIMPTLVDLSLKAKPITGLTLYNLMIIAHQLCPVIAFFAPLRLPEDRELPEPDIRWCVELEPINDKEAA